MSDDLLLKSGALIRELREKLATLQKGQAEPVAIVGMACRFPGDVQDLDAFWRLLEAGQVTAGELPAERLRLEGGGVTRLGSFLTNVDQFDAAFFDIPAREAQRMDPQQRIFLEVAWHALEDAGQTRDHLEGSETGVFVGVHNHSNDYFAMQTANLASIDAYTALGTGHDVIAGRLAYWLDLRGPATAINTACSSSLVAVHLACQSLREHDCQMAVVGGVNLQLTPLSTLCGSRLNMLSPDGRSKTFDEAADGFGRGEGCGVVVLKRLSAAERDRDRIHAVLLGTAINQDGRTNGLTAPNGLAQRRVIERALARAARQPQDVGYIEAHGTGTPLGDPIEVEALSEVYGRAGTTPCRLGSVKANIGHLEAAAGIASLIKAALVVQKGVAPPIAGLRRPSTHLADLDQTRLSLPQSAVRWQQATPRLAAVSAFGWSGTNAHVLVEQAPLAILAPVVEDQFSLTISAATEASLGQLARSYEAALRDLPPPQLASFCYTANTRRTRHAYRLTVHGRNAADLAERLRSGIHDPDPKVESEGRLPLLSLPPYPYDRQSYWLDLPQAGENEKGAPDDWFYQVQWHETPLDTRLSTIAAAAPGQLLLTSSRDTAPPLETATSIESEALAWMQAALREMGLPSTPGQPFTATAPGHERLLARLFSAMVDAGVLSQRDGQFTTTGKFLPPPMTGSVGDLSVERRVLRKCGPAIADVLRGRRDPLELLFGGSGPGAEALYKESPLMQLSHRLLRQVFDAMLDAIAPFSAIDALEIGAGTGSATAALLTGQTRPIREYRFTDVARTLVTKAEREFAQYPFFTGGILDIEAAVPAGPKQQYDVVIAANVVHATASIRHSLAHIESLLKPGGVLLLLETTAPRHWVDLVFGLTPGWWRFADPDLRQADALLTSDRWLEVLSETFGETAAVPLPAGAGDVVEQTVLIARKPLSIQTTGKWGILGAGQTLAAMIEKQGGEAVLAQSAADPQLRNCVGVISLEVLAGGTPEDRASQAVDTLQQAPCPVWFVTSGAQPIAPGASTADLAQSTVWGLGATAAIETPQTWGGLIDLDPQTEWLGQMEQLFHEIVHSRGESRIALRQGKRFVPRFKRLPAPRRGRLSLHHDGAYLLTGATGAVGPQIARWFADRGARFLVLAARGPGNHQLAAELRGRGVAVHAVPCDIGDQQEVDRLFARFGREWPTLRGVIHAAAKIEAVPLAGLQRTHIEAAFRAKISGTDALLRAATGADFFVCFSSAAATLGAKGRAHYGAANAYMDSLAAAHVHGHPAPLSIEWGSWDAQVSGSDDERELIRRSGFQMMPAQDALDAMERLTIEGVSGAVVADLDWNVLRPALELHGQERFLGLVAVPQRNEPLIKVAPTPVPVPGRERIVELIETEVRRLFALPAGSALDPDRGFFDMGMDSLMSVELKNRLEAALERSLPGTLTLNYPTISALADFLEPPLDARAKPTAPLSDYGPIAELSQQQTLDALAEELQLLGGKA